MSDANSRTPTSQKQKYTDVLEDDDFNAKSGFNKVYFEKPNETSDVLALARTLFDLREYRKCINLLKPFANSKY